MTWQEFTTKVGSVIDAMGLSHDEVDIRYIDILGSEGIRAVEIVKRPDDHYEMFVE